MSDIYPIRRCYRHPRQKDTFLELYNIATYNESVVVKVKWWNVNAFMSYKPYPMTSRTEEIVMKKGKWAEFEKVNWRKEVSR